MGELLFEALAVSSGFVAAILWLRVAFTKHVTGEVQSAPVVEAHWALEALCGYAAGATALSVFVSQVIEPFVR